MSNEREPVDPEPLVDRANELVAKARVGYQPDPRLATPFGVPEPEAWRWLVSEDVAKRLRWLARIDTGHPITVERLFGIVLTVDETLPPDSMTLEPTG